MTRALLLMMLFLLLSVVSSHSQDNSWIITIATGDTLSGCSLISLDGDSLRVRWSGFPVSLPVESLRKLQYHRRSEFLRGAFYGSAAGGLAGTFAGSSSAVSQSSVTADAALGALAGFVLVGLAAEHFSRDDRYDLENLDPRQKYETIEGLFPLQKIPSEGRQRP